MQKEEEKIKFSDFAWNVFIPDCFTKIVGDYFRITSSDAEDRLLETLESSDDSSA